MMARTREIGNTAVHVIKEAALIVKESFRHPLKETHYDSDTLVVTKRV